jgi:hypothetical protein
MNPRVFCRERTFRRALLLTYSFDPVFFEHLVLADLWAGRASDILVIGDGNQVNSAVRDSIGQILHLGKRYLLTNASHAGAFHPKLLLRLGETEGAVMIGSGNVTSCGWGGNRELATSWLFGPNHPDKGAWLYPLLEDVMSWCASDLERDAVRRMQDVPWLPAQSAMPLDTPLLYSNKGRTLGSALAERWAGRQFSEMRVFTGSTDESGAFLRWAHQTFGIQKAVVALTPSQARFSAEKLAGLPLELRVIPMLGPLPLHAKFYYFEGPEGAGAVMGSPNCSAAAWLIPPDVGGNIETALIYDSVQASAFEGLLEILKSPSLTPEQALQTTAPAIAKITNGCPYELIGLRWDASSHRIMGLITPQPEDGTTVTLLLGSDKIKMKPAGVDEGTGWFCDIPGGLEFSASEFAQVRLDREKEHWITSPRWIDHLVELHHSTQAARFLEPIRGLENTASSTEQRRILDDLQTVALALFTDFASFRDIGFGKTQEALEEAKAVAPPVDPGALIRSLVETQELGPLGGGPAGSVSITGILRLLFEAERTVADTAANDEKLDEGQTPDADPKNAPDRDRPKDDAQKQESVSVKLQARLASQMNDFLGNLSEPEFAEKCSATQMIQGVCFPLAVALRGRRHGWVSNNSAETWARKVAAVLFRGKTVNSPGLLHSVEQRYKERGLADAFREIVGDGTLWMVLIATLGNSDWHETGTFIEKAMALRQVFKDSALISSAQAPRLMGLLGQLRIDDAHKYLSVVAPEVSDLLDRIEAELMPVWQSEARQQVERKVVHRIGDLLWRANVGWAVCLSEAIGRDSVSVRRGSEQVKIGAGFFVNVSELATRHHRLSELLTYLQARLASPVAPDVGVSLVSSSFSR